ncbi:MAG: type IV pilus secretin PilQ [Thermodesulfobacteriota bacterium]|nr:type IV pilus secretin PilQ [Thermodesulfobacteriota bacterium]
MEKKQNSIEPVVSLEKNEEKVVEKIDADQKSDRVEIEIIGNRKLTYTSVKQSFPLGVAVYLPATRIGDNVVTSRDPGMDGISRILVSYADKEQTTARVEVFLTKNSDYEVEEHKSSLKLIFYIKTQDKICEKAVESKKNSVAEEKLSFQEPESVKIPKGTATLSGIDFDVNDNGRSEIALTTSQPVKYDIKRDKNSNLTLELYNTDIPDYRERPLITTYFKSAVESVLPVNRSNGEKNSHVKIKLRDQVAYRIVQDAARLTLYFEPSTIEPLAFDMAKKSLNATGEVVAAKADSVADSVKEVSGKEEQSKHLEKEKNRESLFQKKKEFTGEKIRLDFFETDIKNVFRILQSISGKNFAVDRDVTGNVTLTLDKPVPWDQVLDLVLKMNHLGTVQEGSIVRIATLATMKQEEDMRSAAFEAKKRAMEQRKSLEPLVTEYIPINYSSAESDIKPHLEKILTPDRGKLSVDARTNMVIMTDTQSKVDQAKELIYRLDKVTPQIMISARIVEVSKNFSKKLGIDWGMSSKDVYRDDLGGTYGFDVVMNHAVASTSSIGYTFSRITGTPFSLNARLTASEIKGDVKIVSSPRVLTLDNKKARIKQGIEFAYLERDDSGGSSVEFKDIDLLLEVTPHVTPDRRIAMIVNITKNDIDSITDGIPSLSTNEAETELLINDGNTIVIGGIVKTTSTEGSTGFPFLSNIPGLGRLFRSDSEEEKRNELLIFITPTIVQLEQKKN